MSTKRKSYSVDFKAKLVLEVLEGEKTLNEIEALQKDKDELAKKVGKLNPSLPSNLKSSIN